MESVIEVSEDDGLGVGGRVCAGVGAAVGDLVGGFVGSVCGGLVGDFVGLLVGDRVGTKVGGGTGAFVGFVDGCVGGRVGDAGCGVGALVGGKESPGYVQKSVRLSEVPEHHGIVVSLSFLV